MKLDQPVEGYIGFIFKIASPIWPIPRGSSSPRCLLIMFSTVRKAVVKLITVSSPLNLVLALVFQRILLLEYFRTQTSLEQSSLGPELSKEKQLSKYHLIYRGLKF